MVDFEDIFKGVHSTLDKHANTSILKAGDIHLDSRAPFGILTGIPELDYRLGRPGLPAGKIIEYFGFEMSGKTTAAFHALAQAQRKGGAGIYIDAEASWDESKAIICGIDPYSNFSIAEPNTVEGIFLTLEAVVDNLLAAKWNKPFVAIVDSVTSVQTNRGMETEIGAEPRVGEEARVIRHAVRKLHKKWAKANMVVIFINHAIANIASSPFAKQSTSSGGHIIKFQSSVRISFSSGSDITKQVKGEKIRTGMKSFLQIVKLKGSPLVFPKIECLLTNDCGFDSVASLLEAMIKSGMVADKSKSYALDIEGQDAISFSKNEWSGVVESLGGFSKLYDWWIDMCIKEGKMQPWSEI